MELTEYLRIIRRWWLLILLMTLLTSSIAFVYRISQEAVYQAEVKIFTGGVLQDPNPASTEIQTGTDLANTYANLVKVRPVLEATIENLDLSISPGTLSRQISTSIIPETPILVITLSDSNPLRASEIANELANQLIQNSPTNLTPELSERSAIIENEISQLVSQISAIRQDIQTLDQQLSSSSLTTTEETDLANQREILVEQVAQRQQTIAELYNSLNSIDTQTNRLTVIEPAAVPTVPTGQSTVVVTLLGAMIGLMLSTGAAIALESFDTTIRSPMELQELTGLPVLAGIAKIETDSNGKSYENSLVALNSSKSSSTRAHEGYRALRAKLIYGIGPEQLQRLVITSARIADGKSITAANLAASLAQAGLKTVLVDADMRRSRIHEIFQIENKFGVSSLFDDTIRLDQKDTFEELVQIILQPTSLPKLRVITAGGKPASPTELLGLPHIPNLCHVLKETFGAEVVIFDTPPVLAVADAITLASNIHSSVLIVTKANVTNRNEITQTMQEFSHVDVNLLGTIVNQVDDSARNNYYYSYTYTPYN